MSDQSSALSAQPCRVAGVDEVGRGPLAGPVVCAAVILDPDRPIEGLRDSKKLTERARLRLDAEIREHALGWALGRAEASEIDQLNILRATLLAMQRAIEALPLAPSLVRVDGIHHPTCDYPTQTFAGGDDLWPEISAASIIAKVARDGEMRDLDAEYSGYGFARHKGYPTAQHLQALSELGPTPQHRRSFAPVRRLLEAV